MNNEIQNMINKFIEELEPILIANNDIGNIKYYLKNKLEKFYNQAFLKGQENVLNDVKQQEELEHEEEMDLRLWNERK